MMQEQAMPTTGTTMTTTTAITPTVLTSSTCCQLLDMGGEEEVVDRLVVVRYFLDRPGYNLDNASARFWKNPPKQCRASDIESYLKQQGILDCGNSCDDDDKIVSSTTSSSYDCNEILAEVYMDSFGAFIVLDVAEENGLCFDFSNATKKQPARIDIRLTDLNEMTTSKMAGGGDDVFGSSRRPQNCNMSPTGLFAFVMINGLEGSYMLMELTSGTTVSPSYAMIYGTYAFFVGGLLQLLVGMWEVTRNNIYGATAFSCFGCFWMANGLKVILSTYFPSQLSEEIVDGGTDQWGHFIRELYILLLVFALLKLTFTMNKTTTALICVLIVKLIFAAIEHFNDVLMWIHCILTFLLSFVGAYVFYAEFVNEVYDPPPYDLIGWRDTSAEEAFGALGRVNGLQPRALRLRMAKANAAARKRNDTENDDFINNNTIHVTNRTIRAVQPTTNKSGRGLKEA